MKGPLFRYFPGSSMCDSKFHCSHNGMKWIILAIELEAALLQMRSYDVRDLVVGV
jgi:hypothetical protein